MEHGSAPRQAAPPGRPAHGFDYSDADDIRTYTPPVVPGVASPATTYDHDHDRQLTVVHRPDGTAVTLGHDATNGRLLSIAQPTPRLPTTFGYWDTPQGPSPASGQLKTVTSPDTVTCTYGYDGPLLTSETWSGNVTGAVTRTYDADFREATETVSLGASTSTVTNDYDLDGLLKSVTPTGLPALSIHRRASDGLVDSTHSGPVGGGIDQSQDYNAFGELVNLRYRAGGTVLLQQSLGRDALGRVTDLSETVSGVTGPVSTLTHYDYDANTGWLTRVSVNGAQVRRYEYDDLGVGNGNRSREYGPLDALLASASYDAQDRLLAYGDANYSWTAAGELSGRLRPGEQWMTTYHALGNLLEVGRDPLANGPTSPDALAGWRVRYRVDGQNRRVTRTINGVRERGWLYRDGLSPAAELDGAGALLNRYVYGTSDHAPDLLVRSGTEYRVVTDHLGSVRLVVDATTGAVVQRMDYDAWGALTTDTAPARQGLGYVSGLEDRDTKLVRFGARDYDPGVGRWTAKDQVGSPVGLAAYGYADQDPVNQLDPDGHEAANAHGHSRPSGPGRKPSWEIIYDIAQEEKRRHPGRNNADDAMRHAEWQRRATLATSACEAEMAGFAHEMQGLFTNSMGEHEMDFHNNLEGRRAALEGRPVEKNRLMNRPPDYPELAQRLVPPF